MQSNKFTAIEVLAVIAVILLIAFMLFSNGSRGHRPSPRISCASNLKSIGTNMMMYSDDYNDKFPTGGKATAKTGLGLLVSGHYQTPAKSFDCPESPRSSGTGTLTSVNANMAGVDFLYAIGNDTSVENFNSETGLVRDRDGNHKDFGNILFGDGTRVKGFKGTDWSSRKNAFWVLDPLEF